MTTSRLVLLSMHPRKLTVARQSHWITQQHCRAFASSSSSSQDTSTKSSNKKLERGWHGLSRAVARAVDHAAQFDRYARADVFSPHDSVLAHALAFTTLHAPQRTQIDALEFLDGARAACVAQLLAVNSLAYGEYIGGAATDDGRVTALALQRFCTPGCYASVAHNVKLAHALRHLIIEAQDAPLIERMHIRAVEYAQLTPNAYDQEVAGHGHSVETVADAPLWLTASPLPVLWAADDAQIERVRMVLDVETVENVTLHHLKRRVTRRVQQQNVYSWVFESRVTHPEDVDWRIAAIQRVSGRVVERS